MKVTAEILKIMILYILYQAAVTVEMSVLLL